MLFRKTKDKAKNKSQMPNISALSVIEKDTNILGTLISSGIIDFDGTIDGNIRCHTLTIRKHGSINGDATAEVLNVYGKINGVVRAKHVHLYADCHVEGIIMHETLIIEDGAFMDGKCKRTDKASSEDDEEIEPINNMQIGSNICLIS